MSKKYYKAEEIINILRQVDILVSQGQTAQMAARGIGISEQTITVGGKNMGDAHRPGATSQRALAGKQQIEKNRSRSEPG